MEEYDEVVKRCFLQIPILSLNSCLQKWRRDHDCFHIASLLRGVAKKGSEYLGDESRNRFEDLGRAARSNRITRAHEDNLGRLWSFLQGGTGSSRKYLKSMVAEFSTVASSLEILLQNIIETGPVWFKKLPVLTLLAMFSFSFFFEVYVRQQTLEDDTEEGRNSFFAEMTEDDYEYVRNGFGEAFEHIFKICIVHGNSYFEGALPDRLHELTSEGKNLLQSVICFVKSADDVMPYGVYRNTVKMEKIREGWKRQSQMRKGGMVLAKPPSDDESQYFHSFSEDFLKNYKTLLTDECSSFHTTRTSLLLCKQLAMDFGKVGDLYGFHGYLSDTRSLEVRDVRLQADMELLWKSITARSMITVEKICEDEGLRAHLQKNGMSMFFKSVQSRVSIIKRSISDICLALWIVCIVCEDQGDSYAKVSSYYMDM